MRGGEIGAGCLLAVAGVLLLAACPASRATPDAGTEPRAAPVDASALGRAEDQRRARDVPELLQTNHDVTLRRRTARTLARIADAASADRLLTMLSDEDDEVTAWAAYGLGRSCKSREDTHVKALVARAATLDASAQDAGAAEGSGVDAKTAITRAIGRCAGPASEPVLTAWVRARGVWSERAAYALGDVGAKRNALSEETVTALLEAVEGSHGAGARAGPIDLAIYPLGRVERVTEELGTRTIAAARAILARANKDEPARLFAVKALGRTNKDAVPELVRVLAERSFSYAERAEAARALGLARMGADGQRGLGEAIARMVPDKDPFAIAALGGGELGPLSAAVSALGADPPKSAETGLYALARLEAPGTPPESLARRLGTLRCGAALALSKGAYDSDVLQKCAPSGSEAWEGARLAALVRRPIQGDRRVAWKLLARSTSVRVREDALESVGNHPELADVGRQALVTALASKVAGPVATAASVIEAHPERAFVLAESERRAALDPSAPPPTANPARDVDSELKKALLGALAFAWAEDLVETRTSVLAAAVALHLPEARAAALAACHDPNVTMREHGAKALRTLGDPAPSCSPALDSAPAPAAPELDQPLASATRVVFVSDAGEVAIRFDPELAPVTATRIVELARAGFFKGIVVHRVVPGFVVQFGDPGGDGYGGAGHSLRDEASPLPFGPLDVGVALAGRDTGSSQLFVTLARYPHLDGEYARIGRAEGDWAAIAQGDVVRDARIEPK